MRTWLIWLTACGRLDFAATPRDAAVDTSDATDATDAAEPIIAPACGSSLHFRDDFDNTVPGPLFSVNNDPGITMSESGGTANVNFQAAVGANQFAFYTTPITYAVDDMCVIADVAALPQNGGFALMKLRVAPREAEFFMSPELFHLRTHDGGVLDDIVETEVDATLRFWRFRVQNNVVYWDLSSDNITYFERRALPALFEGTTADVIIGGGAAEGGTMGVATARFESVTATGP